MQHRHRAVIISGDLHNVGDLALLLQCADGVRGHAGVDRVHVRQWGAVAPAVQRQLDEADIAVLRGKRPVAVLRAATGALFIIGGGQMARDNASVPSLASVAGGMMWARRTGGRAAILGCGIDPLKRRIHRWLWRAMLSVANPVTVRDASARRAAIALAGPQWAPTITADLMFAPSPRHRMLRAAGGMPSVVIAPCEDASEGRSVVASAMARMAVQACAATGAARICIVAHDSRPDGDVPIVRRIADEAAALAPHLTVETMIGATLETVLRGYAASALTLTNRLHPVIFSLIAGRPILILDDGTPKLRDTAERFGVECVPNSAERIPDAILARLLAELTDGPSLPRAAAVAGAGQAAVANFEMLAAAIAPGGRVPSETDQERIAAVQQRT